MPVIPAIVGDDGSIGSVKALRSGRQDLEDSRFPFPDIIGRIADLDVRAIAYELNASHLL